ncbi:MAG TPA: hypothetical protein VED37_21150 [Ktedonobacteraceae bacterium]|nr:hypothetical protein [Ktedonobacteraceae bacterium]
MDTRRCLRCHKLLRADAQRCSLCGYVFSQAPVRHNNRASTNGAGRATAATFPSNAPASPHRAGHYSGLHPEDQPYQSSFMPILRTPAITRRLTDQATEDVLEPVATSSAPLHETIEEEQQRAPKRYVASPVPVPVQLSQRSPGTLARMDTPLPLYEVEPLSPVQDSTPHEHITAPLPAPAYAASNRPPRNYIARIFLISGILSFLLASGFLAYLIVLAGTGSPIHQTTNSVHPSSQQASSTAPQLQLSTPHIDFGTASVQNSLTLTNVGGQQVQWQAGVDGNSPWLGITPTFGTFSQKQIVTVSIQRSNLAPRTYISYINFFQQGTNKPVTLMVTMQVTTLNVTATPSSPPITQPIGPTPQPGMVLNASALTFNTIQGQNPAQQAFTLSNPGNALLNWAITDNANPSSLLSISPVSGTVTPASSVSIVVAPNVSTATAGVIDAILTVHATDPGTQLQSQQVTVKITISNQALISASPASISCNLSSTVTTSSYQLNITNTGSATLNWALSQSLPAWITVDTTSGSLPPGYTAFVNIACNNTDFQSGYHTSYALVVSDTDAQTPVVPQNIQLALSVS